MAGLRASDGIWEKGGSSPPCEVLSPGKGGDSELPVVTRCDTISEPGLAKKASALNPHSELAVPPALPSRCPWEERPFQVSSKKKKLNSRLSSVGLRNHYINIKHQDARVYIT